MKRVQDQLRTLRTREPFGFDRFSCNCTFHNGTDGTEAGESCINHVRIDVLY
jgi:hypothetical protein